LADLFVSALDATAIDTKLHCSFEVASEWKAPNKFQVPLDAPLHDKMDIFLDWKSDHTRKGHLITKVNLIIGEL
jgi:hypothetical protein